MKLKLLQEDIAIRLPEIRNAIPSFGSFPMEVKIAIVTSWFRGSMGGSPKTMQLINEDTHYSGAMSKVWDLIMLIEKDEADAWEPLDYRKAQSKN